MIWTAIDFICRETALHLKRERLIAIATISTTAVLMLVLGVILLFLMDMSTWARRVGDSLEVSAYFQPDLAREEAEKKAEEVSSWPSVAFTEFVTREQSWDELTEGLTGGEVLRRLLDNPLSDCVRVRVHKPEHMGEVALGLEGLDGVLDVVPSSREVEESGGFVHTMVKAKRIITWSSAGLVGLVAIAGVCIIHNTIRLALHSRRREIYIMQLIGATRLLIAAPFLLEGMIHGILGAALACCLLIPAHMYLRHLSARSAPFMSLAPDHALLSFGLALCAAGAILGITGSVFSVRRYMRRKPEWHR
jgi:cell division transport system permease protein